MQKRPNAAETMPRTWMLGGNENGQRCLCDDTERGQGDSTVGRDMAEAATVFRGVLLVIFLRPIERSCELYLCHNWAIVFSRCL